jgi:hypothetical protein
MEEQTQVKYRWDTWSLFCPLQINYLNLIEVQKIFILINLITNSQSAANLGESFCIFFVF